MKLEFKNSKEKYKIVFDVFNGATKITVVTAGKDQTKLTDIKLKDELVYLIEDMTRSLIKAEPGRHRSLHIPTYDPETNGSVCNTIITVKKSEEMVYHFTIENRVAGEMRKYTAPMLLSYGIKFEDNISDRESSEKALGYFLSRINNSFQIQQAVTAGGGDLFHQKNTLNNIATKVGAEVSKPKAFGGGGNWKQGGGGNSYQRPAPKPEEPSAAPISDDDIPF